MIEGNKREKNHGEKKGGLMDHVIFRFFYAWRDDWIAGPRCGFCRSEGYIHYEKGEGKGQQLDWFCRIRQSLLLLSYFSADSDLWWVSLVQPQPSFEDGLIFLYFVKEKRTRNLDKQDKWSHLPFERISRSSRSFYSPSHKRMSYIALPAFYMPS